MGAVDALIAEIRPVWPKVVGDSEFAEHLARLPAKGLETARGPDLYLAFACARGDAWALKVFERELLPKAITAARSVDREGRLEDEVRQVLLERLLVATPGAPPKIAEYSGTGPLENWLRSVAIRTALNLLPRRAPTEDLEAAAGLTGGNSELAYLKEKYRRDFKAAFEAAMRALPDEDVNLLRLHLVDGLSIDKLCGVYGVHRATAARRIEKARGALCDATRAELAVRVGLRGDELDSLMRLVRSNVDLSIARVLGRGEPAKP